MQAAECDLCAGGPSGRERHDALVCDVRRGLAPLAAGNFVLAGVGPLHAPHPWTAAMWASTVRMEVHEHSSGSARLYQSVVSQGQSRFIAS